jgi:predicted membrane protein (TIGR00267 family)
VFERIRFLLNLSKAHSIARRYFFTNGYDGALTMLGLLVGFYASGDVSVRTAISACMGAAIALCISGLSSAYISESEERKKELADLESALVDDLSDSDFSRAMRWTPIWIALVNGFAPFLISLFIILPLWLAQFGVSLPLPPLELAIVSALSVIFLLGTFLGKTTGSFWLVTGLRALLIAVVTCLVILSLEF